MSPISSALKAWEPIQPFPGLSVRFLKEARCLPLKWVWEPDGTYRPVEDIKDMVSDVWIDREILVCSVGYDDCTTGCDGSSRTC